MPQRSQLTKLQQAALRNAMALRVLSNARGAGDTALRLAWDFSAHPWLPTISVKH